MTFDLFQDMAQCQAQREELCDGAVVLRSFALKNEAAVFAALRDITAAAPFRHMITPGGFRMSVAMTNCGSYGWVTDRTGYRYDAADPESGKAWPRMPRRIFHACAGQPRQARASRISNPTPASSIDMKPEQGYRSIRTRTSTTSTRLLSLFR